MAALLRLALIAAVFLAGFSVAGPWATCPAPIKDVYSIANTTATANCTAALCSCLGATAVTGSASCSFKTGVFATCAQTTLCDLAFITCMNNVSSNTDLYMSLLAVNAGALYNTSLAYSACQARTCQIFNNSLPNNQSTTACPLPYNLTCISPAITTIVLVINGNFTFIINVTAKAILQVALTSDLSAVLGFPCTIINMVSGSLIVTFTVPVSANNAALIAGLKAAGSSSSWLVSTQAAYTALGGTGTLTVAGFQVLAPGQTLAPTTPAPGPTTITNTTTPAPGSSAALVSTIAQLVVAALALLILA